MTWENTVDTHTLMVYCITSYLNGNKVSEPLPDILGISLQSLCERHVKKKYSTYVESDNVI